MAPKAAYHVKGFLEINEDMVQILPMLEILFTKDSEVEDLLCGASHGSEPSLFFSNYLFDLEFKPVQDDFQHGFAQMNGGGDGSLILTELFLYTGSIAARANNDGAYCWTAGHMTSMTSMLLYNKGTKIWTRGYKTFFMLNSIEHEIFLAHKC